MISQAIPSDAEIWTQSIDGVEHIAFAAYDNLLGLPILDENGDLCDFDFDAFIKALQTHLDPTSACVFTSVSFEKLRFAIGYACIITADDYDCIDLLQSAEARMQQMLNQPNAQICLF